MSISTTSIGSGSTKLDDEKCPDYEAVVANSKSADMLGRGERYSNSFIDDALHSVAHSSVQRRHVRTPARFERYIYTYRLMANAPMEFLISVEPQSGKPVPGKYTFRLSFKTNGIERDLCEPTTKILSVDPRKLDFVVFTFPGKQSYPTGCLWSLRVWLRVNGVDHRIFGEDELWVGRDPDFNSIVEASFARLKAAEGDKQLYNAYVGKALVTFVVKWKCIGGNLYKYSMGYEANGVGDLLFDDVRLRLDADPQSLSFVIFSIPSNSIPSGASHKLRVWIRSPVPINSPTPQGAYALPYDDSYIYQRIWYTDGLKIGGRLDFESLGVKMVMGFPVGGSETVLMPLPVITHSASMDLRSPTRSIAKEKRHGYGFGD